MYFSVKYRSYPKPEYTVCLPWKKICAWIKITSDTTDKEYGYKYFVNFRDNPDTPHSEDNRRKHARPISLPVP